MKNFSLLVTFFFVYSLIVCAQDQDLVNPQSSIEVPQDVNILLNQIRDAENNEDWQSYYLLREQIINKLRKSNPEIAARYNTVNTKTEVISNRDGDGSTNSEWGLAENDFNKREKTSLIIPEWGNDVVFYAGRYLTDFSMDVTWSGDDIYVSIATQNGSSANDSLFIYKSIDGGLTWNLWSTRYTTGDYNKTEILCFDGSGEDYILLFYTFSSGSISRRFNAVRYLISDPGTFQVSTIANGDVLDFAADRNWPSSNYRAMVLYDSLSNIKSVRSEPSSYGTIWQDKYSLGIVGEDIDLCYGLNGSVYITLNGYNTGNLYANENSNYCDPTSWSTFTTLEDGAVNTTMHAAVIASHEIPTDINVQIIYAKESGGSLDLKRANKDGAGAWTANIPFITNPGWDVKYPSLFCTRINNNTVFQNSYTMSQLSSPFTRQINQRVFDGSSWQGSQTISDYTPTGLQASDVAELNGEPIVLYTGSNGNSLYFDNKAWEPAPSPPSNLQAEAVSNSQIDLTWQDNSNNEDGFKIERRLPPSAIWTEIAMVGANITNYSNTGLTSNTEYCYRIYAYNTGGNSGNSNEACANTNPNAPIAPTNLDATVANATQIDLVWQDNSNNEDGFKIERRLPPSAIWTEIATVGANVINYSNTGLTANTEYCYRVYAYNSGGNSGNSNEACETIILLPDPPSNLNASASSSFQIDLSWDDNSDNEDGFLIQRKITVSGTFGDLTTVGPNTVSYSDLGLLPGTIYCYRVEAFNIAGNSGFSAEDCAETDPNAVGEEFSGIPEDFELFNNYPNPFNPSTTIYYAVPTRSFVELTVYDALGREIETLVSDVKEAGYHNIKFEAVKYKSGTYFYRMQAGDFVQVKKMLLIK